MPYIKEEQRRKYNAHINEILKEFGKQSDNVAGEFTYVVYRLLKHFNGAFWLRAMGMGCVICAALEWYRRDSAPYEDEKAEENGDVK